VSARGKLRLIAFVCLAVIGPSFCVAQVTLDGRVVDEDDAPVRDARGATHPAAKALDPAVAQADTTGSFSLTLPAPGDYLVSVDRSGFYALKDRSVQIRTLGQEVTLTINSVRGVFQSVNVNEQTPEGDYVPRVRFFDQAGVASAVPSPKPAAPAQPATPPPPDNPVQPPSASIYGNTGLWKVLSADTLSAYRVTFSTWYDRINRNPGELVIGTFGVGGAIGITNRMELGVSFEANRDVTTGRPDELSFGQEALGFFGDKTPGSPPLASELVANSSRVPQLRAPATPEGMLTGAAGYYELFPFAGLVPSGSAAGDLSFGLKIKLLSESRGAPFGLAIHPYFDLPIHKSIAFLLTHPVGTADLQGGFDGIVSKNVGETAEVFLNAGFRYISQPAHVSVFELAKEVPLGFGVTIPRSARIQLVAESTADIFVGPHTPNTTFGPEDPVDLTIGLRGEFVHRISVSAGYRRPLNQFGGHKNGFVMSFGFNGRKGFRGT
jgi:hypothetical protein